MTEIIGNIDAGCIMMYSCNCGKQHDPNDGLIDSSRIRPTTARMNLLTEYPHLPQISNEYE